MRDHALLAPPRSLGPRTCSEAGDDEWPETIPEHSCSTPGVMSVHSAAFVSSRPVARDDVGLQFLFGGERIFCTRNERPSILFHAGAVCVGRVLH